MSSKSEHHYDANAEKIVQYLKEGYFCYALSYPLDEKNILLKSIIQHLDEEKIPFAVINPQKIDNRRKSQDFQWETRDSWYQKLVEIINQDFDLGKSARDWWREYPTVDKNKSLNLVRNYIEKILFYKIKESKLVIVFDSVIKYQQKYKQEYKYLFDGLKFKNEIYTFIRDCYEIREINHNYQGLNFLFLDTITWSNDISIDASKPPFTIIWKIDIGSDNEIEEIPIINYGLDNHIPQVDIDAVIERVWYWTGGNPFLIKMLLHQVITDTSQCIRGKEREYIDKLVKKINTSC